MSGRFRGYLTMHIVQGQNSKEEVVNKEYDLHVNDMQEAHNRMDKIMNDYYDAADNNGYYEFRIGYSIEEKKW